MAAVDPKVADRRLKIAELMDWLVEDKMVSAEDAEKVKKERRYYRGSQHPLTVIADQKLKSALAPFKVLSLEGLSEWLAKRVGLEYRHIDPLKIDFSSVTEVMSSSYAARFRILPIGVTTKEAIIAVSEPYEREWEKEIARMTKLELRRVIANPQDIEKYQVEFYNLAKSMKGAARGMAGVSGLQNFEQLVEMGSNKTFDANDAHIVKLVDWIWSYAFEQRASDIHIEPRREFGVVRFRIDGVLHQVYQIPGAVL
ncbi:MAG: type II/IV secretion system protein, partial [Burkholderiales bacterium]|nr:type II/IV secretion system protein [Burkholderiales bacterium]